MEGKTESFIMDYLTRLRDRLPVNCLLCRSRTPGGLCEHCRAAVTASMSDRAFLSGRRLRCPRCALAYDGSVVVEGVVACPDCSALSPSFDGVAAAFDYGWPGDLLIQQLKNQGRFACAPVLAAMLAQRVPQWITHPASAWVVAVPSRRSSLVARGYNPAAEVGRSLARRLRLPWRPDLLSRMVDGPVQKGLGRSARHRSAKGTYACRADVAGRTVLVVDDVMTTGATLDAIASVMKEQGAAKVWGAVVARTSIDHLPPP